MSSCLNLKLKEEASASSLIYGSVRMTAVGSGSGARNGIYINANNSFVRTSSETTNVQGLTKVLFEPTINEIVEIGNNNNIVAIENVPTGQTALISADLKIDVEDLTSSIKDLFKYNEYMHKVHYLNQSYFKELTSLEAVAGYNLDLSEIKNNKTIKTLGIIPAFEGHNEYTIKEISGLTNLESLNISNRLLGVFDTYLYGSFKDIGNLVKLTDLKIESCRTFIYMSLEDMLEEMYRNGRLSGNLHISLNKPALNYKGLSYSVGTFTKELDVEFKSESTFIVVKDQNGAIEESFDGVSWSHGN
ncbi:hypothetical protein KNV45_gp29 [uncultured phage cr271_1]|uniref:Uncharacterized protein n=1 Tax=uncultured phage cr271_1 TaxID=2772078 RepID=A0A7M1S1V0_9CAUD|nr:hypothetical protein KNV45_gp29 [uncultured phage cr271_1]QOR59849.1 hypothetical protein [uncultured phage cr271_1]